MQKFIKQNTLIKQNSVCYYLRHACMVCCLLHVAVVN